MRGPEKSSEALETRTGSGYGWGRGGGVGLSRYGLW